VPGSRTGASSQAAVLRAQDLLVRLRLPVRRLLLLLLWLLLALALLWRLLLRLRLLLDLLQPEFQVRLLAHLQTGTQAPSHPHAPHAGATADRMQRNAHQLLLRCHPHPPLPAQPTWTAICSTFSSRAAWLPLSSACSCSVAVTRVLSAVSSMACPWCAALTSAASPTAAPAHAAHAIRA